jgi:hypothetical protein
MKSSLMIRMLPGMMLRKSRADRPQPNARRSQAKDRGRQPGEAAALGSSVAGLSAWA